MVSGTTGGAPGPVLPQAFISGLIGAATPEHVRFTESVLEALAKISPELVPKLYAHPLADAIIGGVASFPQLIAKAERATDERELAATVDAIAEIITREHATLEVVEALGRIVSGSKSKAVVSIACRAIALAGDEGFLEQQRQFLASEHPGDVRVSAKLLGFGRYLPAVPNLLDLVRPDNMAVADAAITALGEIGSPSALPKLHRMLSDLICTEDVITALGKIGDPTSAVRLLPILLEGTQPQREKAARAMAGIARKTDGWLGDAENQKGAGAVLERVVDRDPSRLARFYAIIAFSLLGGRLDPARIMAALGADLSAKEVDAVSGFWKKRAAPEPRGGDPGPKPAKKRRKPV